MENMSSEEYLLMDKKCSLALQVKSSTLKQIVCDQLVANFEHFGQENIDQRRRLTNLPIVLRGEVFSRLTANHCLREGKHLRHFESVVRVLHLFLSPSLKKIRVDNLMMHCPDRSMKERYLAYILEMISIHAPNVVSLKLFNWKLESWLVTDDVVDKLCKLDQLKRLDFGGNPVDFSKLLKICKNLRSLVCLQAKFILTPDWDESSLNVEELKSAFGRLKVFVFDAVTPTRRNLMQKSLSIKTFLLRHVHNLEVIGGFFTQPNVVRLDGSVTSGSCLMHAFAKPSEDVLDENAYAVFSKVTSLVVSWKYLAGGNCSPEALAPLLRFLQLRDLILQDVPSENILTSILRAYGPNLKRLAIANSAALKISSTNLKFIPYLEKLSLRNVEIVHVHDSFPYLGRLKEFIYVFDGEHVPGPNDQSHILPEFLLSATQLKHLSLRLQSFGWQDLMTVSYLVGKKEILREIERFSGILNKGRNNDHTPFHASIDLRRNMAANCPRLKYFRFL